MLNPRAKKKSTKKPAPQSQSSTSSSSTPKKRKAEVHDLRKNESQEVVQAPEENKDNHEKKDSTHSIFSTLNKTITSHDLFSDPDAPTSPFLPDFSDTLSSESSRSLPSFDPLWTSKSSTSSSSSIEKKSEKEPTHEQDISEIQESNIALEDLFSNLCMTEVAIPYFEDDSFSKIEKTPQQASSSSSSSETQESAADHLSARSITTFNPGW